MGALPKLTQRVIALAFAGQMAKDVPGMATELGNELGKPEAERDYKKIAQLTTSGIAQTAFTVGGAMHGAGHPLIEATGAVPLMKAAETIKPVAPLTAAALEQQAGSTIGKKVEAEFNPEPVKALEVPPVEMPIAPEKGAENAEAIRGDQGQLPPSGETAVTGEEAGGHDVQPPPPEQPEPVESGKAEEVAPTRRRNCSVTEAIHAEALEKANRAGYTDAKGIESGFVTTKGKFIDPDKAYDLAVSSGAIEPKQYKQLEHDAWGPGGFGDGLEAATFEEAKAKKDLEAKSLSKEASPSESVPEAGAPPVAESPSVEAAPKTDLGAAPAD
jgi:hypothetical protein